LCLRFLLDHHLDHLLDEKTMERVILSDVFVCVLLDDPHCHDHHLVLVLVLLFDHLHSVRHRTSTKARLHTTEMVQVLPLTMTHRNDGDGAVEETANDGFLGLQGFHVQTRQQPCSQ
jgi:hypothetical protein